MDGHVTIRVAGELDIASVPVLARELHRAVARPAGRTLLDLSRVTFCGTVGVDLLLDARLRAAAAGGSLAVERAHSSVLRPLRSCGDLDGLRIAQELSTVPLSANERRLRLSVLSAALSAAVEIAGAPMGNAQLYDPAGGVLRIVSQRGFHHPFLTFFETVADRDAACGVAAQDRKPILVEEVTASPVFLGTPALDVLGEAGVGACASVPISAGDGTLIGVVSTHHAQATQWTDEQQRALEGLTHAADHLC
ncbi:GAF domain-containing protein [Streptomyces aureoverticillatus]|uniref:GAF domain-containing protein n=1 Tax=Streptomyces aureoverticillatus TaxID=66871 RepID=UPI0013DCD53D|nr:GAF domain-containing protein [Streptomyces aureoverticillatus]QIB42184.1 GAF domain-containing protein [Streptomyces aureoverticillatus]